MQDQLPAHDTQVEFIEISFSISLNIIFIKLEDIYSILQILSDLSWINSSH